MTYQEEHLNGDYKQRKLEKYPFRTLCIKVYRFTRIPINNIR